MFSQSLRPLWVTGTTWSNVSSVVGNVVAAVLASVLVARVDVRARERHVVEAPLDADIPEQTNNRRAA